MGSCENLTAFEEPLGSSVIEKHSCDGITEKLLLEQGTYLGTGIDVIGANVNSNDTLGGCSRLSNDESTHCVSSNDATDRGIDDTDGQVGEGENTVAVYFEKVLDDDCGVSELCDKNNNEVGVGNLPSTALDSSCVSFASGQENGGCSGDGFAHELGNVTSPLLEKCVDDKCQSLADVCLGETDGLILENAGFEDYDTSVKSTEIPLEEMHENVSPGNHIQQDEQKDDRKVNGPFVDGVVEVLEEENDILAEVNVATGNHTDASKVGEMLNESTLVTGLLINDEKDDKSVVCNLVQEGDFLEDRSEGFAGIEKNNCCQMLPGILEKPSGLTAINGSQSNGVEKDSFNSVQEFGEVKEANYGDLVKMEKEGSNQMLPSQGCEETLELEQFSTAPSDYVSQDDQRKGEIIDYVSSEGVTGVMEENSAAFDCILPLPGDTVPMGPAPGYFSPANCIRQNECKDHDECTNCTSFEEVRVDKSYVVTGTETNFGDQVSSLKNFQIRSETTPMTGGIEGLTDTCYLESPLQQSVLRESASGVSNNSADCNEGNRNSQSICNTVKEEKSDASADIGVNLCNWNSAAYSDNVMTSFDGRNNQNDDKFFSGLSGETLVKQIEENKTDNVITMPVKSFMTSLEGLHMADALSEATQKDEQRNDTTVEVLSEENVTELVEDKRDATADLKFEICTDVFPVEEKSTVSLLICRPTSLGENSISDSLNATELLRKDASSSCAVDHSGKADHDKEDNSGVGCLIKTNDPDIVSSSSRRSSRTGKSRQKTTKRAARKSRSKAKVQSAHGIDEIILKMARKKRSCSSKQARSSMWGLLDNLTRYGSKSDVCTSSQALDQGSHQVKSGKGSRKRNKTQTSQSSLNSSTRCLRFKVKVGKEICKSIGNAPIPEVVDTAKSDYANVGGKRTELDQGNLEFPNPAHSVEVKLEEEGTKRMIHCFDEKPEDAAVCTENSALDGHHVNKEYEGNVILEKSAGDAAVDDYSNVHPNKGFESLKGIIGNDYVDPGTSPDSEVINAVPDILVGERSQDDLRNIDLTSETFTSPGCITGSNRGKKRGTIAKPAKKRGGKHVIDNESRSCETLTASPAANTSNNSSSSSVEPLPLSKETEVFEKAAVASTEADRSKSNGSRKEKSKAGSRRKSTCAQGGNRQKSSNKRKVKEKGGMVSKRGQEGIRDQVEEEKDCQLELGIQVVDSNGKCDARENIASSGVANMDTVSADVSQQYIPPESAWVLCDDCSKWRRIPVALANSIDENCRWVCKDNVDKTFADCSISQEKSNADINTELGISDCEEDASDGHSKYNELGKGFDKSLVALPESSFRRIDSNMFLHRSRKTQTIDEIMVCHCKPPKDSSRLGCGDECLNRMLNIECVRGTCPCGELCSNQQFQKRNYANMQWFPCGKKGFGLQLLEDVPKGQFIIEYVGEVLDMQAYEARQTEYAAKGHKHFYFMTLNGSEVIDACAKGNLGRFINHSCDPNCRTEKWMVNGEICIGLFAMRDMKKGEELTFDYNYVRVFGAAAKKCHCGSPHCRGYIGGDPQNTDIIYQGDSDDEYPEPVMIDEGETANLSKKINPRSSSSASRKIAESTVKERNELSNPTTAVRRPEIISEIEESVNQSASALTQSHGSEEIEDSKTKCISVQLGETSQQAEDVSGSPMSIVQQETSLEEETLIKTSSLTQQAETASPTVVPSILSVDGSDANKKTNDTVEDKQDVPKSRPRIKTSRSSGSVKKGKTNSSAPTGNKDRTVDIKVPLPSIKPKKPMEGSSNGRFEAVQEKLNELLDADGGISKRKDAPRGYLKLLLLTAVSGTGANKEAIQSNRDLSMILDGLLKTRSRMVLTDIINKNGLQMLHNILKQYRSDFKKIPILRKLLKILEYLAVREILTIQHISGGPPCPGMESLRESMLSLTEHDDKQVHQIARNFRDRWIPKHLRKPGYMDRDDGRMDFHRGVSNRLTTSQNHRREQSSRPSEAIDCVTQSPVASTSVDNSACEASPSPCTGGGSQSSGPTRVRKRKSRWDQPAPIKRKEQKTESSCAEHGEQITEEDAPPGFSAPCNPPLVPSDALSTSTSLSQQNTPHLKIPEDVVVGHPQKRFISRLPVSYGVPLLVLQQVGSPKAENVDGWVTAPGMPFHPFPPLPPFPRDKKNTPASEECHQGENNPSTTGAYQSIAEIPGGDIHQQASKRIKVGSSNDLGKRFFRQQKWNRGPPWLWRRNEHRNSYGSPDSNCRVDDPCCNTFYQHPQQQNNH